MLCLSAGEFDMRVKSCSAFTENSRPIDLSDEHGCVLRPKMISKFMKIAGADTRATVVTYAFFHAFKFPDSMAVNIRCEVTPSSWMFAWNNDIGQSFEMS